MISTILNVNNNKRAFSLFEIIVVIMIISIVYFFTLSNINVSKPNNEQKLNLTTIKPYLIKQLKTYDNLLFFCIKDASQCFLYDDKKIIEEFEPNQFFIQKPKIFNYKKSYESIDYPMITLDDDNNYEVDFKLQFDKKNIHNEFILQQSNGKAYIFSNILSNAKSFESLDKLYDHIESINTEVKDAF